MDNEKSDDWIDSGAEYLKNQAASLGIDAELVKISNMNSDEHRVLEWFAVVSHQLTPEETTQLQSAVRRTLAATVRLRGTRYELEQVNQKLHRSHKESRRQLYLGLVILTLMLAFLTFESSHAVVHPGDGRVHFVQTSWWGFTEVGREIRWMKSDQYTYPAWMAKDATGNWHPFFITEF